MTSILPELLSTLLDYKRGRGKRLVRMHGQGPERGFSGIPDPCGRHLAQTAFPPQTQGGSWCPHRLYLARR